MLITKSEAGVFGKIENKRANNENWDNKNHLHNRHHAHLTIGLCFAIGNY